MSHKDMYVYDFTDFWFDYLSEPNSLVMNNIHPINEMDEEDSRLRHDDLLKRQKG